MDLYPKEIISRRVYYYLLLFLAAFLAFFPVISFYHPLKYDIIDQAYPWRYFIGECLKNGNLPLWNPYQLLGSPIHADPQSSAWYPITWFIGYIFGYDIYTISIDFFIHIFLTGLGMFYLAKRISFRDETAFFMAISYMLCGFFIGNAQHFMWIISGTWIPFIIGSFIEIYKTKSLISILKFSLSFFMIMTGGYPGFIFLLIYLLIILFIHFSVEMIQEKDPNGLARFTGMMALAAIICIMLSMVMIISVYYLRPEMTRGAGVTVKQALFGAFTPQSFISFILPYASIRNMEFYQTDLSMSNAYFGIIPLVCFIASFFIKRKRLINIFLVFGLIMLSAAVGNSLPVREFLYNYIPLMNLFRFPALFRIFAILCFIIVSGYAFDKWISEGFKLSKNLISSTIFLMLLILAGFIWAVSHKNLDFTGFIKSELFIFSDKSTISQHILFQGIIQLIFLGLLLYLLMRWKKTGSIILVVLGITFIDLVFATRLNSPYTVYYHQYRSKEIKQHADRFPEGFPLPDQTKIINNTDQRGLTFQALWRNLNIFHKQVSWEGYNPIHLKGFEDLADNHPKLYEATLNNPLVYLSDKVFPNDSIPDHERAGIFNHKYLYFNDQDYSLAVSHVQGNSSKDTVIYIAFSPSEAGVKYSSAASQVITLLQNNYKGWKIFIDGKESRILTSNLSFISTLAPAGEHKADFLFEPAPVIIGFYISAVSLILVIAGLMIILIKKKRD